MLGQGQHPPGPPALIRLAATAAAAASLTLAGCAMIFGLDDMSVGNDGAGGAGAGATGGGGSQEGGGGAHAGGGGSGGDGATGGGGAQSTYVWGRTFGGADKDEVWDIAVGPGDVVAVTGWTIGPADFGGGELHGTAGNDDVFVAMYDAQGQHLWSERYGDGQPQVGYGVAFASDGDLLVTGGFIGEMDFGAGVVLDADVATHSSDVFLAKLDASDGSVVWARAYGLHASQIGGRVAALADGRIALMGTLLGAGSLNFGGGLLSGGSNGHWNIFAAVLDSSGWQSGANHWSAAFGDAGLTQQPWDMALDSQGNMLLTGRFRGDFDFGDSPTLSSTSDHVFAARLAQLDGDQLHSEGFGNGASGELQEAKGVATSPGRDMILVGNFEGTLALGGDDLLAQGEDAFVASFDAAGSHSWSKRYGDASSQRALAVAVDAGGRILLGGYSSGDIDFGGGALTATADEDACIAVLDASGAHLWSGLLSGPDLQHVKAVDFASNGDLLVAGEFRASIDLGAGAIPVAGYRDGFLVRLSP